MLAGRSTPALNPALRLRALPAWMDWTAALVAFAVPLAFYVRTLAPTVYALDSAELTTGAYTLGIVHAPGSPVYLLLAHLFTWLPVGDVGYRVNLLSALAASLAVVNIYLSLRQLAVARPLALVAAWSLAFSYYFWSSALFAELYALQAWFASFLLLIVLKWRSTSRQWLLGLFCLVFGLGLGNHLSLVLLAPGFAWLIWTAPDTRWRRPAPLAIAGLCGLLGMASYLYLPIRYLAQPALNYARDYWQVNLATWDGFWWMVSGRMFSGLFWGVPLQDLPAELGRYLHLLWSNFLGIGLTLGALGLLADFRQRPALHGSLQLIWLVHLLFYLPYNVVDKDLMWLPTYLVWSLWLGLGLAAIDAQIHLLKSRFFSLALPILAFSWVLIQVWINYPLVDLSQDTSARRHGERILENVDRGSVYLGSWADIPVLEYLQIVEGMRADVTTINLIGLTPEQAADLTHQSLRAGKPVFTSADWISWPEELLLEEAPGCACYRLFSASALK